VPVAQLDRATAF